MLPWSTCPPPLVLQLNPPHPPPDPVVHQLIPLPLLASASSLTFCTRAGVQFCKNLFNFDPQV